jgi:acyl-CoA thioester hydrolase
MFHKEDSKTYPQVTHSRAIIRFQDCDPFRHLNNTNYFNYFFNAREDQVAQIYNLNMGEVYETYQTGWVVYNHQIAYIRPAMMGEWVRMSSSVIHFTENTVLIEYYMTDDAHQQLKTLLWSTMKYIDMKTGKTTPHQPIVTEYLQNILLQDFDHVNTHFHQRIGQIKELLKK